MTTFDSDAKNQVIYVFIWYMSFTHVEKCTTHVEIQHLTIVLLCLKVQIINYIILSLFHM